MSREVGLCNNDFSLTENRIRILVLDLNFIEVDRLEN